MVPRANQHFRHFPEVSLHQHMRWGFVVFCFVFSATCLAQPQGPDTLWTRFYSTYSGYQDITPGGLAFTSSGETVISGSVGGDSNSDLFLLRLDSLGQEVDHHIWGRPNDFDGLGYLSCGPDGGYFLAGTHNCSGGLETMTAMRVTAQGDSLWQRFYEGLNHRECMAVCPAWGAGCLLVGYGYDADTRPRTLAIRVSDQGDAVWSRGYDPDSSAYGGLIVGHQTPDTGYVLLGSAHWEPSEDSILLVKIDSQGQPQWARSYHHWEADLLQWRGWDVAPLSDGYVIAGDAASAPSGESHPLLIRCNLQGDTLWTQRLNGFIGMARRILMTRDGNLTVLCFNIGLDNQFGITLVRITPEGEILWIRNYFATYGFWGQGFAFDVDAQDHYLITTCRNVDELLLIKTQPDPTLDVNRNRHTPIPSTPGLSSFPNPFNPSTTISFSLAQTSEVNVSIFDITGRLVQTLAEERFTAGEHSLLFDGSALSSGIYFARLQAAAITCTQKMVLLK